MPVENLACGARRDADEVAVFAEPLAAAFEILEQVRIEPGDACVVLGDGKLGLLAAMMLAKAGARVLAVGQHQAKLAMLRHAASRLGGLGRFPRAADLVVEATGSAARFRARVASVRPRGTLVLKSPSRERPTVDLAPLVIHEMHVVGSRCGPFPPAMPRSRRLPSTCARSSPPAFRWRAPTKRCARPPAGRAQGLDRGGLTRHPALAPWRIP